MTKPANSFSRVERVFQNWLDAYREGEFDQEISSQEFVDSQPDELRADVERMIADYKRLRERLGDGAPGFEPGRIIGDFQLVRELGRGGMGVVWEAQQLSIKRRVALKLLFPHFTLSDNSLGRFRREAEAGGRLGHPSIVQVFAVGEADGVHFMAQELVHGGYTIADWVVALREERDEDRPLAPDHYVSIARMFRAVADALAHAHDSGVIHRDVKPSNILLAEGDEPKLADFGLAHVEDALTLSRSGEMMGTPFYMSPEQAGSGGIRTDGRTDVFSLGATLYEALTLTRAFDGDTTSQVVEKIRHVDPPNPRSVRSQVPLELDVICKKALEKVPDNRYESMRAFAEDLQRFLDHQPILARPPGPLSRGRKWVRRHPVIALATIGTGVALAIVGLLLTWALLAKDQARAATANAVRAEALARRSALVAQRSSYASNIYSAEILLRTHQQSEAARRLDECSEDLRGWEWGHLALKARPGIGVLHGHTGDVRAVAFHPDGERVASGSDDRTIRLWNLRTGETLRVFEGHTGMVTSLAFTPDGSRIISGSRDRTLGIWELESGRRIAKLEGHEKPITCIALSPDGKTIASASWDMSVRVWDTDGRVLLRTLDRHRTWVVAVAFSADGRTLITGANSSVIQASPGGLGPHLPELRLLRWRVSDGEFLGNCELPDRVRVKALATDPHKDRVLVGTGRGQVLFVNIEDGRVVRTIEAHEAEIRSIAVDGDGARFVTGSKDRTARVFNARTGKVDSVLRGHEDDVAAVAISPDGRVVASGAGDNSEDSTVRLWDAGAEGASVEFGGHVGVVSAVASQGGITVTASWDRTLRVRDAHSLEMLQSVRVSGEPLEAVAIDPKGRIAVAGRDRLVRILQAGTLETLLTLEGHPAWVGALAFSPDGSRLVSGSSASNVGPGATPAVILEAKTRSEQKESMLLLWDATTGKLLHRLQGHRIVVESVAFGPKGERIAAGAISSGIRLWSAHSGEPITWGGRDVLEGHDKRIEGLAFSPDGEFLISASEDRTLRLWNLESGELVTTFLGHEDGATCVAFHPAGKRIASGSKDGTVRVWDLETGQALVVLRGHEKEVTSVIFDAGGKRILSTSRDKKLRVWESDIEGAQVLWSTHQRVTDMQGHVRDLLRKYLLVEIVLEHLKSDVELDEKERLTGGRIALQQGNRNPSILQRSAWKELRKKRSERHADALEWIRAAHAEEPTGRIENTFGAALCRAGDFSGALTAFESADRLDPEHDWPGSERVGHFAFRAWALHGLGRGEESRALLIEARELARSALSHEPRFLDEISEVLETH